MSVPPPPPQLKSNGPPPKQACDSSGPAFLADIRAGRSLKKVPDSEKRDRSAPLASKPTDRTNESTASGPTPVGPPIGLPNPFAGGVPKLKSVGSLDAARNNAMQNVSTKQSSYGYIKSHAPPPPPPPSSPPPTTSSVARNNFSSSSLSSSSSTTLTSTTYQTNHRITPTANNNATAVRNGSSAPTPRPIAPPTPARPSITKKNSNSSFDNNYPRYNFSKNLSSSENNQSTPSVVSNPPPVQVVMLSSKPTSLSSSSSTTYPSPVTSHQLGKTMTIHENNDNNNNVSNGNNTVNDMNGTPAAPPPPSGRSPRRKPSSSNRYQRVGSTNTDVNGIPVGQSTKVIRISSNVNGNITDQSSSPSLPIGNPCLPSAVRDAINHTLNSRAHPTPPPPPPPSSFSQQPSSLSSMNNYNSNNNNNNIANLVRNFESRFTFHDIGHLPVPKSYQGPKSYRVGSINNSSMNNSNISSIHNHQMPYRVAPSAPRNY
ncbi:unnamed protein product [Schistosoma turkestanicum]|nr:unnamed protein product [Schistosoma turkestanicum]